MLCDYVCDLLCVMCVVSVVCRMGVLYVRCVCVMCDVLDAYGVCVVQCIV